MEEEWRRSQDQRRRDPLPPPSSSSMSRSVGFTGNVVMASPAKNHLVEQEYPSSSTLQRNVGGNTLWVERQQRDDGRAATTSSIANPPLRTGGGGWTGPYGDWSQYGPDDIIIPPIQEDWVETPRPTANIKSALKRQPDPVVVVPLPEKRLVDHSRVTVRGNIETNTRQPAQQCPEPLPLQRRAIGPSNATQGKNIETNTRQPAQQTLPMAERKPAVRSQHPEPVPEKRNADPPKVTPKKNQATTQPAAQKNQANTQPAATKDSVPAQSSNWWRASFDSAWVEPGFKTRQIPSSRQGQVSKQSKDASINTKSTSYSSTQVGSSSAFPTSSGGWIFSSWSDGTNSVDDNSPNHKQSPKKNWKAFGAWLLLCLLVVGAFIGCGFAFANHRYRANEEENAVEVLTENTNVCLPGRIQEREQATLFLSLEGLRSDSVDGLDSIIERSVKDGYNKATRGCEDLCNRWSYLTQLNSQEDITMDNGKTAVYAEVKIYLSEYKCPPGETFASVFPPELNRMRRQLLTQDQEPSDSISAEQQLSSTKFYSRSQGALSWSTILAEQPNDVMLDARYKRESSAQPLSRGSTAVRSSPLLHHRALKKGLDFSSIMAAIEEELFLALKQFQDRAGFVGIQEVTILQEDSNGEMTYTSYARIAQENAYARRNPPKNNTGPKGAKTSKAAKKEKSAKAAKATKAPSSKCPPESIGTRLMDRSVLLNVVPSAGRNEQIGRLADAGNSWSIGAGSFIGIESNGRLYGSILDLSNNILGFVYKSVTVSALCSDGTSLQSNVFPLQVDNTIAILQDGFLATPCNGLQLVIQRATDAAGDGVVDNYYIASGSLG